MGQKRILEAWKEVRNYLALLEYIQAIQRRGIFSDVTIVCYIKGYERVICGRIREGLQGVGEEVGVAE